MFIHLEKKKKQCGVVSSSSHLPPGSIMTLSPTCDCKGIASNLNPGSTKAPVADPLSHLQAVLSGEIVGTEHRAILSRATTTLTDCHIQYSVFAIIRGSVVVSKCLRGVLREEGDEPVGEGECNAAACQYSTSAEMSAMKLLVRAR